MSMMILYMQILYVLQKNPTNSFCPFKQELFYVMSLSISDIPILF